MSEPIRIVDIPGLGPFEVLESHDHLDRFIESMEVLPIQPITLAGYWDGVFPPVPERDIRLNGRLIGQTIAGQVDIQQGPDGAEVSMRIQVTDPRALRAAMRSQAQRKAARRSRHPQGRGMRKHMRRMKALALQSDHRRGVQG